MNLQLCANPQLLSDFTGDQGHDHHCDLDDDHDNHDVGDHDNLNLMFLSAVNSFLYQS